MNLKILKGKLLLFLTRKKRKDITNIDISKIKKILIFRYDRIGDMIQTTPLIKTIKENMPYTQLYILASKTNSEVLANNPNIESVFINQKNNLLKDFATLLKLRYYDFDLCIELDHSVTWHAIFRHLIIKPKLIVSLNKDGRYNISGSELKLYDLYSKFGISETYSERILNIAKLLKFKKIKKKFDIYLDEKDVNFAKNFIQPFFKKFKIVINIEGHVKDKYISFDNIEKICNAIHAHYPESVFILISHPKKTSAVTQFINQSSQRELYKTVKTNSILNVAAIISKVDFVLSPDTSIVHLASAFNKPTLSIHEKNILSFKLWKPTSDINGTVFSNSSNGIIDCDFEKVIKEAIKLISQIKI